MLCVTDWHQTESVCNKLLNGRCKSKIICKKNYTRHTHSVELHCRKIIYKNICIVSIHTVPCFAVAGLLISTVARDETSAIQAALGSVYPNLLLSG